MKHIVFMLGSYFPHYSAVGYCAQKVIDSLEGEFRITVICVSGNPEEAPVEQQGRVEIRRIITPSHARRFQLTKSGSILVGLHRLAGALRKLFARETVDASLIKAYGAALKTIGTRIDALIPVVFPFESVLAAVSYKSDNPDIIFCPYLFDNFVESRNLHLFTTNRMLKRRRHLALEEAMLEAADAVLAMHPLRRHFLAHFEEDATTKIGFLEHPLLYPPKENPALDRESVVKVVYTGSLIKGFVEPDYLMEMAQILTPSSKVAFDFYVMGNAAHRVRDSVHRDVTITNHGRVAKAEANRRVAASDMLLNIGEVRGQQISSKIFEYIATGKPIIHMSSGKNDIVSEILQKYPLALCLLQDPASMEKNALRCSYFIDQNKDRRLPYADVAALYPEARPETTAEIISEIVERGPVRNNRR